MSREREAFHRIRDNAQNSVRYAQDHSLPRVTKVKTNYLSAVVWTSVVATVVCSIFMGLLLYVVNESRIEERLETAASHALYNLENVIKRQNVEIQQLKAENKKIYNHIKFWTPIEHRFPPGVKEVWDIPGYGVPRYERQSYNICQEGNLCLPFLE
tara:strand:+ start:111 stop:578 length:468 start_codon:yes stop_codon:yes gene_type:complete